MIKKEKENSKSIFNCDRNVKTLCHRQKDYVHSVETSSSRSVSCVFGIVLLLEREPRRQVNADLKMANETRVLIHAIVEV